MKRKIANGQKKKINFVDTNQTSTSMYITFVIGKINIDKGQMHMDTKFPLTFKSPITMFDSCTH